MKFHIGGALLAFFPVLCLTTVAAADPIRIDFDVQVNHVAGDMTAIFGGPIAVGDLLHGSVTYDPTGASDRAADPYYGYYVVPGQLALRTGSGLAGSISSIQVYDNHFGIGYPTDYLAVVSDDITAPGFYGVGMIAEFYGPPDSQSGAPLPGTAAAFRAAYNLRGGFSLLANQNGVEPPWDDTTHNLFGSLEVVPSSPTPEPGALLLFGPAAAICLRVVRRRQ